MIGGDQALGGAWLPMFRLHKLSRISVSAATHSDASMKNASLRQDYIEIWEAFQRTATQTSYEIGLQNEVVSAAGNAPLAGGLVNQY